MSQRLLPPLNLAHQTMVVHGRTYSAAPGGCVDAPDQDAMHLAANGWLIPTTVQGSGATTQRPTNLGNGARISAGYTWMDTTVGAVIVYDGATWRNPASGAAV